MAVAAVDDNVAWLEQWYEPSDGVVDGCSSFDHEHDFAWSLELPDQFLE
jgi:hypothetical protein